MATRYSGDLKINVTYDDRNFYRTSVSRRGKSVWHGTVGPVARGIASDSPQAYDEVASTALSFADHEVGDISDNAEYDEKLSGYLVRRKPLAKASGHATKKGQPLHGEQYRATAVGKGPLLGGVKRHVSSWFDTKKEANDWLMAIVEGNKAARRVIDFVTIERRDANGIEVVKISTGPLL